MSATPNRRDVVGIVIPCHNRKDLTLSCLYQLRRIIRSGFETQVYLIDDGSTDGTSCAVREKFNEVRLLRGDGNLYWTGAVNMGIAQALKDGCHFVHLMNDDIRFHDDFLVRLYNSLAANPKAIAGSITCDAHDTDRVIRGGFVYSGNRFKPWVEIKGKLRQLHKVPYEVDAVSARSLLIPRNVIEVVGLPDSDKFPHSFADIEYCFRIKRSGYRIFVEPRSIIFTQIDMKYHILLLNENKLDAILRLWFDNKYFGLGTVYHLSKYCPSPSSYLLYQIARNLKWSILLLILDKNRLKKRLWEASSS